MTAALKNKNIILGICGGIAVYKVCGLVTELVKAGASVTCIMTENAKQFVTPLTFQTLSGNRVYSDMFDSSSWEIGHISLAKKADIIVIVPATADMLSKLACGSACDLVCSTVLASKAKILVCPAMNHNMFHHAATRGNIKKLEEYGYDFVMPRQGRLACGTNGDGCLEQTDVILKKIADEMKTSDSDKERL